jgi:hypothetical protein
MFIGKERDNKEVNHKSRARDGETPDYKAFHEVVITKDIRNHQRTEKLIAFIENHIEEYKGQKETNGHGIPAMLFSRKQDAQKFADALYSKLDIPKEHTTIKAQKFKR